MLLFILLYLWDLENKKRLTFKRYYLLFSIIAALLLPLLSFEMKVEPNAFVEIKQNVQHQVQTTIHQIQPTKEKWNFNYLKIGYVFISTLLFLKFIVHLLAFYQLRRKGKIIQTTFGKMVVHKTIKTPFSFGNIMYINEKEWNENTIDSSILYHEQAHIRQKHSIDILFIECLKIVMWFQPLLYFYKKKIQENHEYLADEFAINQINNSKQYQHLLVNYYSKQQPIVSLSSSIHFNDLKKRLIMMKNTKKGKLWTSVFYTSIAVSAYIGFVGIEAQAAEISSFENHVLQLQKPLITKNDKQQVSEKIKEVEKEIKKSKPKHDPPIKITYRENSFFSGEVNIDGKYVEYTVDGNKKVTFYDENGIPLEKIEFQYTLIEFNKIPIPYSSSHIVEEYFKFENENNFTKKPKPKNSSLDEFNSNIMSYLYINKDKKEKVKYIFDITFEVNENGDIVNYTDNSEIDEALKNLIKKNIISFGEWDAAEIDGKKTSSKFYIREKHYLNYPMNEQID